MRLLVDARVRTLISPAHRGAGSGRCSVCVRDESWQRLILDTPYSEHPCFVAIRCHGEFPRACRPILRCASIFPILGVYLIVGLAWTDGDRRDGHDMQGGRCLRFDAIAAARAHAASSNHGPALSHTAPHAFSLRAPYFVLVLLALMRCLRCGTARCALLGYTSRSCQ